MAGKNERDTKQERKPEHVTRGPEPKHEPTEDLLKGPIKAGEFNVDFRKELAASPGGEKLRHCFQCGTCTSDCPIARFSDSYRPREIIRMAQLGLKQRVLSSKTLWLCAACYTCTDRCPQDVEVASVIRVLRNLAVKGKLIPSPFRELGKNIVETGIAYRIPELRLAKRAKMGLPPLPKSNQKAIEKLAKATGFNQMIQQRD
ncbi:MAG: 4Fe-4S dicluster domain-containing protein [Candidatus Bathyarchaeota archaeon]|nr:MAG: 4Fe-4S dicluster domain-containing protein [Candidatus Bathyarchaeota archaeon]